MPQERGDVRPDREPPVQDEDRTGASSTPLTRARVEQNIHAARQRHQVDWLLAELLDARQSADALRRERAGPAATYASLHRTLEALDAYVTALEGLGWPVPRHLQMELNQTRLLLQTTRNFR